MLPTMFAEYFIALSWIFVSNAYSQSTDCGHVSKKDSEEGNWPWLVAIAEKKKSNGSIYDYFYYNGFLIDRRHVLTTGATYISKIRLDDFTARIGNKRWTEGEDYNITCITRHPRYDSKYTYDDLAILTLSRDVNTPNYAPVCLPDDDFRKESVYDLTMAGWTGISGGHAETALTQYTGLRIISNKDCNTILYVRPDWEEVFPGAVSGDMLCTVNLPNQPEPCDKLYGAPLMYKDNRDKWIALGIHISRKYCNFQIPSMYIEISDYLEWIVENTGNGIGECN